MSVLTDFSITEYEAIETKVLRVRLNTLLKEHKKLFDKKTEIEKLIFRFNVRFFSETGEFTLRILEFKKRKSKKKLEDIKNNRKNNDKTSKYEQYKKEYEDITRDYEEYTQQVKEVEKEKIFELNDEQKQQLKKKFRRAAILCHPDKVPEEKKKEADLIFKRLFDAYKSNDLDEVSKILANLEKGKFSISLKAVDRLGIKSKKELKIRIKDLEERIIRLKREINLLKNSDVYQLIKGLDNWDEYFVEVREKLKQELNILQNE